MPFEGYTTQDVLMILLSLYSLTTTVVGAKKLWDSYYDKRKKKDDENTDMHERFNDLKSEVAELKSAISEIQDNIYLLIDSDREDIKSYIVAKYNFFVVEKGCIDVNSLEAIEKRYKYYEKEHGNGFVTSLVEEIRELPKVSKEELYEH